MPVYQLMNEMPHDEFVMWHLYFEKRPVGWRNDDAMYKVLQTQGVKHKPEDIFMSLKPIYTKPVVVEPENKTLISTVGLPSSLLFQKILNARGGDQIPL